jgi:glycosyltransferase involved in cell wall biosynthesis
MRVLIDTTFECRAPFSGTGIYIRRVIEALRETGEVEVVEAANAARRPPAGGGIGSVVNLVSDLRWSCVELPRRARSARAELIHHPLPAFAPVAGVPQLITVADLAFELLPDSFARSYRTYARVVHRAAARRAAGVICVSESTADDVRRLWAVDAGRITVAPHGPGQELDAGAPPDQTGAGSYFLYVGDDEPRKNLETLLAGYAAYRTSVAAPLDLVLAGSAPAPPGMDGVRAVMRPSADQLGALYGEAEALVHPALHEGFGLTTLEAMRLGVPVIAAPSAAVREVCGDAARYAEARDPEAFAEAMRELAGSPELRLRLRDRGRERAATFSWARSARAHLAAYSLAVRK